MKTHASQESLKENSSQPTHQNQIAQEERGLYATYDYIAGQIFWFLREVIGLSQNQVADRCGYHILSHWVLKENGQALVSITDIIQFCEVVGWTPIQFQTFMTICKNHIERGGVTVCTSYGTPEMRSGGYYKAGQETMQKLISQAAESVANHPEQLKWWTSLKAGTIN